MSCHPQLHSDALAAFKAVVAAQFRAAVEKAKLEGAIPESIDVDAAEFVTPKDPRYGTLTTSSLVRAARVGGRANLEGGGKSEKCRKRRLFEAFKWGPEVVTRMGTAADPEDIETLRSVAGNDCVSQFRHCFKDTGHETCDGCETVTVQANAKGHINFFTSQHMAELRAELEKTKTAQEEAVSMASVAVSLKVIGVVRSPYKAKFGTPRQSALCPATRGVAELSKWISPESLDGLTDFSHCWLLWLFDEGAWADRQDADDPLLTYQKTKVRPPKLGGARSGVLATRSPHRPSPIGLSVCSVLGVDGRKVFLGGIDILDGTPLIDIKPYHPLDAVPPQVIRAPSWLLDAMKQQQGKLPVRFTQDCLDDFSKALAKYNSSWKDWSRQTAQSDEVALGDGPYGGEAPFTFFSSPHCFLDALEESLTLDPRTVSQQKGEYGEVLQFDFDNFRVVYHVTEEADAVQVTGILPLRPT